MQRKCPIKDGRYHLNKKISLKSEKSVEYKVKGVDHGTSLVHRGKIIGTLHQKKGENQ